jgi:adenylate cyclase
MMSDLESTATEHTPALRVAAAGDAPGGTTRRLSAIMFTDMVGYTALMQQDEARARRDRDRQRAVLERHIKRHRGRVLQFYGDGALSVFDSAIEAVSSAVSIQRELRQEPSIPLRVGIHLGDVVHDAEGVFGDGVNVASRVQTLGTSGSVLISSKVYDEIKNQRHLSAVSLGEFNLKNVQRPLEVFAIAAEGLAVPRPEALPGAGREAHRSVAVLPFMNMSADRENEYLSDGITEELINVLTRVNGLQVTARTSSFAFKGKHVDIRQIAKRLSVDTVLEGSVRKFGDRLRITAQLIDAATGYHLFSHTYDRTLADIFELQDEIARAIVDAVQAQLVSEQSAAPLATTRTSFEAHALYLHGLHEFNRWTPESKRRAVELLERCIETDPRYAPAYATLATVHGVMATMGQSDPGASWKAAETAALRGTELDPTLGDAHIALGLVNLFFRWDVDTAYQHIQKGIGLSPSSASARSYFGIYLIAIGEAERAVEEIELALRLDPLSLHAMHSLIWAYQNAERYEEALALADRILEIDPGFRAAYDAKGRVYVLTGRFEEAARMFERVVEITGDVYKGLGNRGHVYALLGRTEEARRALEMLKERERRHPEQSLQFDFAMIHEALGERDQALQYFEAAGERRLGGILLSVNDPGLKELHADPRYWELIDRYGLTRVARDRPPAI